MKRAEFLKRLGLGAVAVVVAPLVIAEVLKPEKLPNNINLGLNNPHIIKDTYEVTGSEMSKVRWVKHGKNYLWYNDHEFETRKNFENQMELMMLKNGNQSLSSFLSKIS